jgi:hypothetical protein
MNINHDPLFDREKVTEHYTKKDGVPVTYVCTSDLNASDVPVDIYYRDTPHPEFGNCYFGLYHDHVRGHMMICNADVVESYEFGMVNDGSVWHYSQSHHDYKSFPNGAMIDGGRQYIRSSPGAIIMHVKNGKFYAKDVKSIVAIKDESKEHIYPGGCVQ